MYLEKFKLVENQFMDTLGKIITQEYSTTIIEMLIKQEGKINPYLNISLINKKLNKKITFYLVPYKEIDNNTNWNFELEIDWEEKSFFIKDYWSFRNLKINFVDLSFDKKLDFFLENVIKTFLNDEFQKILFSDYWLNVPFDWSPYK